MTPQKQTIQDVLTTVLYALAAILAVITPIFHFANMKTSNAMGCIIFSMLTWAILTYKKKETPTSAIIVTLIVIAIVPTIGRYFNLQVLAIQSGLDLPARWIGILGGWIIWKTNSLTRIACVTFMSLFAIWIEEFGFDKWFNFAILA